MISFWWQSFDGRIRGLKMEKLREWKTGMEAKGLRVNAGRTKGHAVSGEQVSEWGFWWASMWCLQEGGLVTYSPYFGHLWWPLCSLTLGYLPIFFSKIHILESIKETTVHLLSVEALVVWCKFRLMSYLMPILWRPLCGLRLLANHTFWKFISWEVVDTTVTHLSVTALV